MTAPVIPSSSRAEALRRAETGATPLSPLPGGAAAPSAGEAAAASSGEAAAPAPGDAATSAPGSLHPTSRDGVVPRVLELMKFRLSALVVVTTAVGAAVASEGAIDLSLLAVTVLGTGLAAGGANGLNQWIERELDARMVRTAGRPLPSGRMKPRTGLALALGAAVAGPVLLGVTTNLLTAVLAAVTTLLYVLVYTPLKRKDPACTLVGAVCGAIPPMMGVSAVTGSLDFRAGLLFVALFVWQIPHFLSLAWLYRDDYERGGFRMMPVVDRTGATTTRMVLAYTVVLMPLGVAMTLSGMAGWWFTVGAVILGAAFSAVAVLLYRRRTAANARRVFYASLVYLPLLLGLLVLDRGPAPGITPWNEIGFHIVEMPRVPPAARRPLFVPDAGPGAEVLYGPDASPAPDALPDASTRPDAVPSSAPDVLPEALSGPDALPLPDAPDAPAAP